MSEEIKKQILDFFKSKAKTKTKFYMNDIRKVCEGVDKKAVKKIVSEMIEEGTLMYFSTGSTTMIQLAEADIDHAMKE